MTQRSDSTNRRRLRFVVAVAIVAAAGITLSACTAPGAAPAAPAPAKLKKPSAPIALTILDGGGDLAGGGQVAIDQFVKDNPDLVSTVTYQTAAATDVSGKLLAQASAGTVSISLVLGGSDVLGSAEPQNLLLKQDTKYAKDLPDFSKIQDKGRAAFQAASNGYGVLVDYDQNGPFIDYSPTLATSDVPDTPQGILAWAKAHPGQFAYANPSDSGSGRAWLMDLPYLLGDKNPSDPVNGWAKTWAYLKQLGKYISSYPTGSTLLAQQFGAGQLKLIPTVISHDISFRKNGTYPAGTGIKLFKDQNWITDGHFAMIPAGVDASTLYVDLKLESYMVSVKAQEARLTSGILSSANKNVTLENSGPAVANFVQQYGRPDFFPAALKKGTIRSPLNPVKTQQAFTLWQQNVGSQVGQ